MTNPIKSMIDERGLTCKQAALMTGLDYYVMYRITRGYPAALSDRAAQRIAELTGGDPSELQEQYTVWREAARRDLLSN